MITLIVAVVMSVNAAILAASHDKILDLEEQVKIENKQTLEFEKRAAEVNFAYQKHKAEKIAAKLERMQ